MMVFVFILLTITTLLAWLGLRKLSLLLFIITLLLAVLVFGHNITDKLNLQL